MTHPDDAGLVRVERLMELFPEYKADPSLLLEDFGGWVDRNKGRLIEEQTESMVDMIYLTQKLQTSCADEVVKAMMG